jgi:ADP-dependent NAD(P)H-hydrate dehydratase / NAD(P)H-hydrate epimerase
VRQVGSEGRELLFDVAATRGIERDLAATLPPFSLMSRAGLAVARLALALAPHARTFWIACGPGNNGGDGLVAAVQLRRLARSSGRQLDVVLTLSGGHRQRPPDAARALAEALKEGLIVSDLPPERFDIAVDALLGLGARHPPEGRLAEQIAHMHRGSQPVLAVDLPSGLDADSGCYSGPAPRRGLGPRHTLSLLTLKPGLFTADGRDLAGQVWLDSLGFSAEPFTPEYFPTAWLYKPSWVQRSRLHGTHKGVQGNVVVIGGQGVGHSGVGMVGAAILAARAALHAGAGRVYLALLESHCVDWDPTSPELMFRSLPQLLDERATLAGAAVVCGCGGGTALAQWLPRILSICPVLVLDADALNTLARDSSLLPLMAQRQARGWTTVITPHPMEAARLLDCRTEAVQRNRLAAARALTQTWGAICVLKGSGTVVAAPGGTPHLNASGNGALATAGTGDVLTGMLGAALAATESDIDLHADALSAVLDAVHAHGRMADQWPPQWGTLTAGRLAAAAGGMGPKLSASAQHQQADLQQHNQQQR